MATDTITVDRLAETRRKPRVLPRIMPICTAYVTLQPHNAPIHRHIRADAGGQAGATGGSVDIYTYKPTDQVN